MASAIRPILVLVCYVNFSVLIRHLNLVYMDEIKQINHLYENVATENSPLAQNSIYILGE